MERIGEYLIIRLIGAGGMGKVFEAEERLSKRRVAIKVLRPELVRSESARRLFLNEMAILAQIDHPHVVRSLSCQEIDGQLVMALEYLNGKTLRQTLIERGALPWQEAVRIVVQIAAALSATHRQEPPIVHRDLKPENIMLEPDGAVKVMDFGIAKVLETEAGGTTHSVGTLQYMSPEQIDAGRIDGRSDLYCLGLIFYELLAGHPPFQSASPRELLNLQCTQPPPPFSDSVRAQMPKGVERVVLELLQKAADARPNSADAVLAKLEPFAPEITEPTLRTEPRVPVFDQPNDTVALIDGATRPREVPLGWALLIILGLSLAAGLITYFAHSATSGAERQDLRTDVRSVTFAERP